MRYKGEYSPSFLLDPEEYSWYPLKECVLLLDKYAYACFAHPTRSTRRITDSATAVNDMGDGDLMADREPEGNVLETSTDEYEDPLTAAAGAHFNPAIDEVRVISSVTSRGVEVVVGGTVSTSRAAAS